MRWTRVVLLTRALLRGRPSRVVLTPRRRRQASRSDPRSDGDKKARSPGRSRSKPLKPSRAGMPGDPGVLVVTNARAYYQYTRSRGCNGHPAFPTPSLGRKHLSKLGRLAPRDCEVVSGLAVIASEAKQSTPSCCPMDCFASLAMTIQNAPPSRCAEPYASSTASAPFTASAPSITVRSNAPACTVMFSAKKRASVT